MPDDDIKGMLEEVQRSLDRSRRALEALEHRQQTPQTAQSQVERLERAATLPAAAAPVRAPLPGSVDSMLSAVSSPTPAPTPPPAAVSYARRRTSAYNSPFLTPPDGTPVTPPVASSEVETGRRDETSEWSSGERPSQRQPPATPVPSSSPPPRSSDRPETGRYTFVSSRRAQKK